MSKFFILVICFILLFLGCDKSKEESSLNSSRDSLELILSNPNRSYKSNTRAASILYSRPNDSITRSQLFDVGNNYYINENLQEFKTTVEIVLQKSVEQKDTADIAKSYRYLAEYYKASNKNDSAYIYFSKAEKFYLK